MLQRLAAILLLTLIGGSAVALTPFESPGGEAALVAGAPRGVHLSFTQDPKTTMTVTWFTNGSFDPGSVVEYGETLALGASATGTTQPAPGVDVLVHEATLTGLSPGTRYHYRVGSDGAWSQVFSFRTDDGDARFRALTWGDMGFSERAVSTRDHAIAFAPELVLIAGDLSYANGKQERWDVWFDLMEPLFANVPLMPAIGNHEGEEEGTWRNAPYRARFALPGEEIWYSFEYGRVHFTMHDSDTATLQTERRLHESIAWLADDLGEAAARRDAGEVDRIVVVQHHPLYGNHADRGRQLSTTHIATEEALLHANGVDLLVTAHNHHYERSKPMAFNAPTDFGARDYVDPPVGFIELIVGGGGQSLYEFRDPNDFAAWSAAYAKRYHLKVLDFADGRIDGQAVDTWFDKGRVFDRWSLRPAVGP